MLLTSRVDIHSSLLRIFSETRKPSGLATNQALSEIRKGP